LRGENQWCWKVIVTRIRAASTGPVRGLGAVRVTAKGSSRLRKRSAEGATSGRRDAVYNVGDVSHRQEVKWGSGKNERQHTEKKIRARFGWEP